MWKEKKVRKENQKLWANHWWHQGRFFRILLIAVVIIIQFVVYTDYLFALDSNHFSHKNPYFYQNKSVKLSAMAKYQDFETVVSEPIDINMYLVKQYKKGKLYRLVIPSVIELGAERTNIYFYVTEDQIYRVFSYIYKDKKCITFYDNDELLISTLNTDEKLIKNSEVICQSEPIVDKLAEEEVGIHVDITKKGNKIFYNRCDIQQNGERGFYESFVWKKGKGLIKYRSGYKMESEILYLDSIAIINNSQIP